MLKRLSVNNFAIIKEMNFLPDVHLNILTGETGAGKSIILDALNLILGARADVKLNFDSNNKSIIEGEFQLDESRFKLLFESLDLDFDTLSIIRREFNANGKSRSFINDTPVTLNQIKSIGEQLISIHSQHENTHLNDKYFQFNLLDNYAKHNSQLNNYQSKFKQFKSLNSELQDVLNLQANLLKEKDYLEFLIQEFDNLQLKENEESQLELELNTLTHAESILSVNAALVNELTDSEMSIVSQLSNLRNKLRNIENFNPEALELGKRIQSVVLELKDLSSEAETILNSIHADDTRMEELNLRINAIQLLKRKHNVSEFGDLFDIYNGLCNQLLNISNTNIKVDDLNKQIKELENELKTIAKELHNQRVNASSALKKELESLLKDLEMPHAQLIFELNSKDILDEFGNTELNILFSANLGIPPQALNKIASGGELSRLALCIRCIEAENKHLNTLIFDEIDTGVSGKVADTIGKMFKRISKNHQLIAITHLPQVAGYGDQHFMVCKTNDGNSTISYLKHLNEAERIDELANMLSGNKATEIARKNAKELLKA
jgi:DNA repair protein RecN (Recombination protein N)